MPNKSDIYLHRILGNEMVSQIISANISNEFNIIPVKNTLYGCKYLTKADLCRIVEMSILKAIPSQHAPSDSSSDYMKYRMNILKAVKVHNELNDLCWQYHSAAAHLYYDIPLPYNDPQNNSHSDNFWAAIQWDTYKDIIEETIHSGLLYSKKILNDQTYEKIMITLTQLVFSKADQIDSKYQNIIKNLDHMIPRIGECVHQALDILIELDGYTMNKICDIAKPINRSININDIEEFQIYFWTFHVKDELTALCKLSNFLDKGVFSPLQNLYEAYSEIHSKGIDSVFSFVRNFYSDVTAFGVYFQISAARFLKHELISAHFNEYVLTLKKQDEQKIFLEEFEKYFSNLKDFIRPLWEAIALYETIDPKDAKSTFADDSNILRERLLQHIVSCDEWDDMFLTLPSQEIVESIQFLITTVDFYDSEDDIDNRKSKLFDSKYRLMRYLDEYGSDSLKRSYPRIENSFTNQSTISGVSYDYTTIISSCLVLQNWNKSEETNLKPLFEHNIPSDCEEPSDFDMNKYLRSVSYEEGILIDEFSVILLFLARKSLESYIQLLRTQKMKGPYITRCQSCNRLMVKTKKNANYCKWSLPGMESSCSDMLRNKKYLKKKKSDFQKLWISTRQKIRYKLNSLNNAYDNAQKLGFMPQEELGALKKKIDLLKTKNSEIHAIYSDLKKAQKNNKIQESQCIKILECLKAKFDNLYREKL